MQQTTIYEHQCLLQNQKPDNTYCPWKHALQQLDELIMSFQKKQHAVGLMMDANQTPSESFSSSEIKPYTI